MEKFVTFCTGKKLDESTTSHKEGTETVNSAKGHQHCWDGHHGRKITIDGEEKK